ncbi:MAG: hypothetical protein GXY07_13895 [Candidatus Hydrogenedentes bacterium]|nr:hypothetical protein [Candidatus Hydrogenedentota bacterium]
MNDSDKPETLGEFLLRTLDSQSPEEIPEEIEKLSREHYIKMHDRELDELLKQPGYGFSMGMHFYEALERLSEQQLTFINALCIFQYYEYFVPHAWVVNHAANQIIGGLSTGKLSPDFTLSELKAFIIRHNIELRDDWKTRLELLKSAGIEKETMDITPGAGAVPVKTESRTKRTSTRGKGGNKPKRIWHKLLVKACIEKKITGTAVIAEILKAYLDETALLDDEGSIVSEINNQDVRHDSDYVTSGKFDAFLKKNRNNKKLIGGNDAETKTFKAWLSKNYKH